MNLTDESMHKFGHALSHLVELRKLRLEFSAYAGITNAGVQSISKSILSLKNLEMLSLQFSG